MTKGKKALIIAGVAVDLGLTIFLFVVSIIMLATLKNIPDAVEHTEQLCIERNGPFIGYLQAHPTTFLLAFVVPLFILLAINIAVLVIYVKKAGKAKAVEMDDLDEEQKAALKAELLKDLQENNSDE